MADTARRGWARALFAALLPLLVPAPADAEPTEETEVSAEYRVQHSTMSPLSLNDTTASDVAFAEQRLRVEAAAGIGGPVRIRVQADLLNGVLFGDNGSLLGSPRRNRGADIAARSPNLSRLSVGRLDPGRSSLDLDNYGLVLEPADAVTLNHVYAEVSLPFGLLRGGRQPISNSRTVLVHSGQRINRWGISRDHDSTDGLALATKLSVITDVLAGLRPDVSLDKGLFLAVLMGQVVEQDPARNDDDLQQIATKLFYTATDEVVLGRKVERASASVVHSWRHSARFDTDLQTLTGAIEIETKTLRLVFHHTEMLGQTREVAEALALFSDTPGGPELQQIRAFGGFGELALRLSPVELSFEVYYASGDDDPQLETDFEQLTFAPDTNVGLHLFENVLAYQTERSARLGVENLRALGPPTLPLDGLSTRGGLQNAVVLFPQVLASPTPWLDLRAGILLAFTHVPSVDPIGTLLHADGVETDDDKRNFSQGPPGSRWGTEYDVGLTLRPREGFSLDLEGAYLVPGDALVDEHGDAVDSFFAAVRMTWWTG